MAWMKRGFGQCWPAFVLGSAVGMWCGYWSLPWWDVLFLALCASVPASLLSIELGLRSGISKS